MDQIIEYFTGLLDTNLWPPRWHCGIWSDFLGWLYISSELMIWCAYFIIPVILIWIVNKKPNFTYSPLFWMFGLFIVLCGITHLMDAIIFWWPAYRLSALLRFITAIVSMVTVFLLIKNIPNIMEFLSNEEYTKSDYSENQDILLQKIEERDEIIKSLKAELAKRNK